VTVKAFIATTILDLASRGDRARLHGGGRGHGEEKDLVVGKVNEGEERETLNLEEQRMTNAK
jgi:hypothetical protein